MRGVALSVFVLALSLRGLFHALGRLLYNKRRPPQATSTGSIPQENSDEVLDSLCCRDMKVSTSTAEALFLRTSVTSGKEKSR